MNTENPKNWPEKHPVKANLILLCLGIFFAFLLMEGILRFADYYQYIKPANRVNFEKYKKLYSDERDTDYVFGHHPNINVRLKTGDIDYTFITNSEGLRETKEYPYIEKSVIFLGDSIIEGTSVENEEGLDEVFEDITGVTSLNFGLGSANTVHEYYWLKGKYKKEYNTKLIILGFCLNDLCQNDCLRYFDGSKGNWKFYKYIGSVSGETPSTALSPLQRLKSFLRKSRTVVFLYRTYGYLKYNIFQKQYKPPLTYDEVSNEDKANTELYIKKINEFSKDIGADFVVVIFPRKIQLTAQYDIYKRKQDALIEVLEKNDIPYIDLFDMIKENYLTHPDIRWYSDDIHPSEKGHRLIGEYLARELPDRFPKAFQ
ncbi:MAG: SGNH/GDSL hydrolase family protein [Candidatus Omnitrophica bacterium]|nr:SGNH/GDSL hydrolase family protein [Candidatus Omnitrophota bacterium]